ncbi:TonB-dependent receptor [uncultured Eudoraea sp.]|uniref:SusC/RagA family TonB-linked outer membrane protein n=1 Tax=uncultured Eudoraea sp. TaxID=1035614 RepID=UPI00262CC288|nr:TonB-dependent receptor [uncultured Eudoraea sp.]
MIQKCDYHSLKLKRRTVSFGIKFLSMLVFLGAQFAHANTKTNNEEVLTVISQATVTGIVTDDTGAPLPGASVVEKGTSNGTQTDFDGNYTLEVAGSATLVISYIGFATQEIAVDNRTSINVSMIEDASQLSEVIVTGYGTQTRGDISGAVSSVDISEAVKAPIVNAAEALQGRVTGVTVIDAGAPGASPKVNIRGFGTSNNTNPLYIIDGVQTDNPNVLNSINPADIEQMNVLKDASAAIYGARAANGVVIITTKSGGYNMDKVELSVDVYTGFSRATNLPDLLNPQQHADMIWAGLANDGSALTHPQYGSGPTPTVPSTLQGYSRVASYNPIVRAPATARVTPGGTNWLEAITRDAPTTNASVSIQNGTESGKFFMSVNYLDRQGVQLNTGFEQGLTRLNSEFKISDRVFIGEHLTASFSNTQNGNSEAFENGLRSNPLIPLFDDTGGFGGSSTTQGTGNARNPLAQLSRAADDYNKLLRVFGDVYLRAEIVNNLTFKTTFSGLMESFDSRTFQALDPEHGEPLGTNTLTEQNIDNYNWTWTNTLNYKNTFGEHNINALVGLESVADNSKGKTVSRNGYLFETPDFYLLSNGSSPPTIGEAFDGGNTLFSLFGTANWSFQGKYFATVTVRNDKSSRFLGDNKSQTFPSFSGGWVISNNGWFPQGATVSRLKLKASWGQLGNQTLPASNPTINISSLNDQFANYAINGGTISTGAILDQVGNPDLKWETSESTNIGLELGLWDNKFNLDLDVYQIKTKDLITRDNSLISTTAIDAQAPLVNLGNIKNTGFDLGIGYNNSWDSGWTFGTNVTISHYKNEVEQLISDFQTGRSDLRGGAFTRTQVGQPISEYYGRVVTGLDDTGRFIYQDVDGNGTIDDDDRDYIGSPHPDFTYGINLTSSYKGFDIQLFFYGSQGNDLWNYNKIFTDFPTFVGGNRSTRVLNSWTPTNTNTTLPALSNSITNSETLPNSYFVEDGSFFRLKNLQFGWSLPSQTLDKIGFTSLRFYIQATNLFTITDYNGFDPELISDDNLTLGADYQVYPPSQIWTFGVNLKL